MPNKLKTGVKLFEVCNWCASYINGLSRNSKIPRRATIKKGKRSDPFAFLRCEKALCIQILSIFSYVWRQCYKYAQRNTKMESIIGVGQECQTVPADTGQTTTTTTQTSWVAINTIRNALTMALIRIFHQQYSVTHSLSLSLYLLRTKSTPLCIAMYAMYILYICVCEMGGMSAQLPTPEWLGGSGVECLTLWQ